jgi:hypothetical protein
MVAAAALKQKTPVRRNMSNDRASGVIGTIQAIAT